MILVTQCDMDILLNTLDPTGPNQRVPLSGNSFSQPSEAWNKPFSSNEKAIKY